MLILGLVCAASNAYAHEKREDREWENLEVVYNNETYKVEASNSWAWEVDSNGRPSVNSV
jgi:hypothetical protein